MTYQQWVEIILRITRKGRAAREARRQEQEALSDD